MAGRFAIARLALRFGRALAVPRVCVPAACARVSPEMRVSFGLFLKTEKLKVKLGRMIADVIT